MLYNVISSIYTRGTTVVEKRLQAPCKFDIISNSIMKYLLNNFFLCFKMWSCITSKLLVSFCINRIKTIKVNSWHFQHVTPWMCFIISWNRFFWLWPNSARAERSTWVWTTECYFTDLRLILNIRYHKCKGCPKIRFLHYPSKNCSCVVSV